MLLGVFLVAWSRRRLCGALPGAGRIPALPGVLPRAELFTRRPARLARAAGHRAGDPGDTGLATRARTSCVGVCRCVRAGVPAPDCAPLASSRCSDSRAMRRVGRATWLFPPGAVCVVARVRGRVVDGV